MSSDAGKLTPDQIKAVLTRLVEFACETEMSGDTEERTPDQTSDMLWLLTRLLQEAANELAHIQRLQDQMDAVGPEKVGRRVLIELENREARLSRLNDTIAEGRQLLGADAGPTAKSN